MRPKHRRKRTKRGKENLLQGQQHDDLDEVVDSKSTSSVVSSTSGRKRTTTTTTTTSGSSTSGSSDHSQDSGSDHNDSDVGSSDVKRNKQSEISSANLNLITSIQQQQQPNNSSVPDVDFSMVENCTAEEALSLFSNLEIDLDMANAIVEEEEEEDDANIVGSNSNTG